MSSTLRILTKDSDVPNLIKKGIENSTFTPAWKCDRCEDSEGGFDLKIYRETRELKKCRCAVERVRLARFHQAIEITPSQFSTRFGIIDGLESAKKLRDINADQKKLIARLEKSPDKSLYLFGKTGRYKTTIAWSCVQESGRRGLHVGGNTGRALADVLRNYAFGSYEEKKAIRGKNSFYSLTQLETKDKICVLIDDIEVMPVTEYALASLFELVEKIQTYEQRLIITSNKSIDNLVRGFQTADRDGRAKAVDYSQKLLRRLKELCVEVEV